MSYYQPRYFESSDYQWDENSQQNYYNSPYYTLQQPPTISQDSCYHNMIGEQGYHSTAGELKGVRKRNPEREEDKIKYIISLENILSKMDARTTLMIKNIPNKYNQVMLLKQIDENHKRHYDFFYLPIDFKVTSSFNIFSL